jgi:hypothetical protein
MDAQIARVERQPQTDDPEEGEQGDDHQDSQYPSTRD